jgi:protein TonB
MKSNFLTGDFLPAYRSAYKFPAAWRGSRKLFTRSELEAGFARRARHYERRKKESRLRIHTSCVLALMVMVGLMRMPFYGAPPPALTLAVQEVISIEEMIPTEQLVKPPPPPRPPIPVEVPDDEILDEDDLNLDATLDMDEPLAALPPPPAAPPEADPDPDDEIFVIVENMPEVIGGYEQIVKDVVYPELARKAGITGVVVVQVLITEDGKPQDPRILRSASEILDKAAVAAILKQTFKPGRQRGRAVRVQMSIPVTFRLQQ